MKKKMLIILIILLALGAAGFFYFQQKQMQSLNDFVASEIDHEKKSYTMSEVAKHNIESDCWVIIDGKVINTTKFISLHPGGPGKIIKYCGTDITDKYKNQSAHMQTIADVIISKLTIGNISN